MILTLFIIEFRSLKINKNQILDQEFPRFFYNLKAQLIKFMSARTINKNPFKIKRTKSSKLLIIKLFSLFRLLGFFIS